MGLTVAKLSGNMTEQEMEVEETVGQGQCEKQAVEETVKEIVERVSTHSKEKNSEVVSETESKVTSCVEPLKKTVEVENAPVMDSVPESQDLEETVAKQMGKVNEITSVPEEMMTTEVPDLDTSHACQTDVKTRHDVAKAVKETAAEVPVASKKLDEVYPVSSGMEKNMANPPEQLQTDVDQVASVSEFEASHSHPDLEETELLNTSDFGEETVIAQELENEILKKVEAVKKAELTSVPDSEQTEEVSSTTPELPPTMKVPCEIDDSSKPVSDKLESSGSGDETLGYTVIEVMDTQVVQIKVDTQIVKGEEDEASLPSPVDCFISPVEGPQETEEVEDSPVVGITPTPPPFVKVEVPSIEWEREVTQLRLHLGRVQQKCDDLELSNTQLTTQNQALLEKNSSLEADLSCRNARICEMDEQILVLKQKLDDLSQEKEKAEQDYETARACLVGLRDDFLELNDDLQEHFQECRKNPEKMSDDEKEELQKRLDKITMYAQDKLQVSQTEEDLESTKQKLGQIQDRLETKPKVEEEVLEIVEIKVEQPEQKKVGQYVCDVCGNEYMSDAILHRHRKSAHSNPIASSSPISRPRRQPSPPPVEADNSDSSDEIMIIEEECKPGRPPSPKPVFRMMSSVAMAFSGTSSTSFTSPPLPPPDTAVITLKEVENKTRPVNAAKGHTRDITRRNKGFYCTCGIKFLSRRRLDGHMGFHNSRLETSGSGNNDKPLTAAEIKKEKFSSSGKRSRYCVDEEEEEGAEEEEEAEVPVEKPKPPRPTHKVDKRKRTSGFYCTCGKKLATGKKLRFHVRAEQRKEQEAQEQEEQEKKMNSSNSSKRLKMSPPDESVLTGYKCMTCGKMFDTNMDRIRHRVQEHGHGLN